MIKLSREKLIEAFVNYEMEKYQTNMHVHLKIKDGELYVYTDVSYTISCAERDGGFPIVLMHSQGWGDYPDDYKLEDFDSEADLIACLRSNTADTISGNIDFYIQDLLRDHEGFFIIED